MTKKAVHSLFTMTKGAFEVSYKRLLRLAEIGARRELEKALIDFQVLHIKSETIPVDMDAYDNALTLVDKAVEEYSELDKLIKALESF